MEVIIDGYVRQIAETVSKLPKTSPYGLFNFLKTIINRDKSVGILSEELGNLLSTFTALFAEDETRINFQNTDLISTLRLIRKSPDGSPARLNKWQRILDYMYASN